MDCLLRKPASNHASPTSDGRRSWRCQRRSLALSVTSTYPMVSIKCSKPISIPPADTNTIVYRIIDVSTANNAFSLHMVEDDTASSSSKTNTSNSKTSPAQELYEAIQFLGTVGLLNLDTYATVFDTAARACAGGPPFWLNDPLGDREIVV